MNFPSFFPSPGQRLAVVLDTDTYNEVDDQFALAHLLLSPERIDLQAVYAAPFFNDRSTGPADGMEKSYEEIHRVLEVVGSAGSPRVFRGSPSYLPDAKTPVASEAAEDLVARAMAMGNEKLYVVAIGAPTNVASALLIEPRISEKIVVVWLGGHAPFWPDTWEFNLQQDMAASRVLLDTEMPFVLVPCLPVASHLLVTVPELEKELGGHSRLGTYLTDIVRDYGKGERGWSKEIWDIAATAWVLNPDWVPTRELPSPVLLDNHTWKHDASRHKIRIAGQIRRNKILADFYIKAGNSGV